ncbi:MAG: ATP-binding cassette domain-containing protein [Lachnospiraceae bacterium]
MITVEHLSYEFPQKELYNDISFEINAGEHCAFIGTSGTGKSTLLDMLIDTEKYLYDGKIVLPTPFVTGYVSQFPEFDPTMEQTVFEYISEEFVRLSAKIAEICVRMESVTDFDAIMDEYQTAYDVFEAMDGDNYENNIQKKLNLASIGHLRDLEIHKLSGGEFKLIQIIKEMLVLPDLLIMDEPDVFLDFEHLNALMLLINAHKGCLLVVTHNRFLLSSCFDKILHLENKQLRQFSGNYLAYNFELLKGKVELQELAFADNEEIARNVAIVNQLRAEATAFFSAAKGKTLNARVKIVERLEARKVKDPFIEIKQPTLFFQPTEFEMKPVVVSDYKLCFETVLLEDVAFEIAAGEKVALVGPNGSGKTTLLRDMYKNHLSSIQIDEGAQIGFLSQTIGEMLTETNSIYDEFFELGFETRDDIIAYLDLFGFEEGSMMQKIESLSGGEKNLLQLAKIAQKPVDLLLLDEPTSHLDIYAQLALEKALQSYKGTVLMISHDFYSIIHAFDYVLFVDNKSIRKISMRKFRKMIYANHFNKDYLELEQKKTTLELKIQESLLVSDFEIAKVYCDDLEKVIAQM